MVMLALPSASVALTGDVRLKLKASLASAEVSSIRPRRTVAVVWPGASRKVPLLARKSLPASAVLPATAQPTLISCSPGADSTTTTSTQPSASLMRRSLTLSCGAATKDWSLEPISAVPRASPRLPPTGAASTRSNCSAASASVSSTRLTVTALTISPAAKFSVPLLAVKSAPAVAVPDAVA